MTYRIQPSAQAEADIDRFFNWLSERSPDGAVRWYESFWNAMERLKNFPRSSSIAAEYASISSVTVSTPESCSFQYVPIYLFQPSRGCAARQRLTGFSSGQVSIVSVRFL
jgi:hypothetical protein